MARRARCVRHQRRRRDGWLGGLWVLHRRRTGLRGVQLSAPLTVEFIESDADLQDFLAHCVGTPRYALDTEFHRERTYFPKLALLQIATSERLALIDPLRVDVSLLASLMESNSLCLIHACSQDLEVLQRACGRLPKRLVDTQFAAGFLGYSTPSLSSLIGSILDLPLPKADRLTDWLARPLTDDQKSYAASDVAHLLVLWDKIAARLLARGRLEWALDESALLLERDWGQTNPHEAWTKLKDHRTLRPRARGVAREVAAWRERRAAQLDQPVRHVLADLAILSIAQRSPSTLEQLKAVRGIDERLARGQIGAELLAAVQAGAALPAEVTELPPADDLDKRLRPALTLVSALAGQIAHDAQIDTPLLATRADLGALLADDPKARLRHGWRAEIIGDHLAGLLRGEMALAFDPRGHLVVERRSAPPQDPPMNP
jgi:ribonuclease D